MDTTHRSSQSFGPEPNELRPHDRRLKLLVLWLEAGEGASGQISRRTLSLQPRGGDAATTLMAGSMAFRAERCDMQAFTLAVRLTHICIHTHWHAPRGLPLITADLCTFRLWNDSKADLRTAYHTSTRPSVSRSLQPHPSILDLPARPSITPSLWRHWCLLFLHHCQSVVWEKPEPLTFLLPPIKKRENFLS